MPVPLCISFRIIHAVGYESREFDYIPKQKFADIDALVLETIDNFVPSERYAVRDVILNSHRVPHLVERAEPTPLTPDVLYREVSDTYFPSALNTGAGVPNYPCLARWFDLSLEAEYKEAVACMHEVLDHKVCRRSHVGPIPCYYEAGMSEIDDLLQSHLNVGEFSFLIPREPTKKEQKDFDEVYHKHLQSYGYYMLYHSDERVTSGRTFTAPDIQEMYELRYNEMVIAATAYEQDSNVYAIGHGMDLEDLTEEEEQKITELEKILWVRKGDENVISISEAVRTYIEFEGGRVSSAMQKEHAVNVYSPATWVKAHHMLGRFIAQLKAHEPMDPWPRLEYASQPVAP